jgi:hypothetical protein
MINKTKDLQEKIIKIIKVKPYHTNVDVKFDLQPLSVKLTLGALHKLRMWHHIFAEQGNIAETSCSACSFRLPQTAADEFTQKMVEIITNPNNFVTL